MKTAVGATSTYLLLFPPSVLVTSEDSAATSVVLSHLENLAVLLAHWRTVGDGTGHHLKVHSILLAGELDA